LKNKTKKQQIESMQAVCCFKALLSNIVGDPWAEMQRKTLNSFSWM